MKAVSGLDGVFLHFETAATPMHVASLSLFELPPGYKGDFYDGVKRQIAKRLPLVPVFRRRLAPMPFEFANPVWVNDAEVDLDYHVQHVTLPAPGTMAQLEDCAARLHSELLDRSRPLWRIVVIDGLANGQVGYYLKVHHAVLDGQAGVLLAQALFDVSPHARARKSLKGTNSGPSEHPGMVELAAAALRHDAAQYVRLVRHLPEVVGALAGLLSGTLAAPNSRLPTATKSGMGQNLAFGPHTPLNVPITCERGFAACSIALDALKRLAKAHEAKLNDVVLALASGALRRYLAHHGGIPRKPLIAAMPVSLRAAGNTDMTTQATMTLVNLHTHVADSVKRLIAIRDAASAAKALTGRARSVLPTDFPSIAAPWLIRGLATLYGRSGLAGTIPPIANVVVSNVPGPQVPLYTAGARMRTYWPMSIVEHGVGVNLTVMSYAGEVGFGFTTARSAVSDARQLTQALKAAYHELEAKTYARAVRSRTSAKARRATVQARGVA